MATKTSIYEEYLLATDKDTYLESIKTTNEYRELMIHYCLNTGKAMPTQFQHLLDIRSGDRKFALKNLLQKLESSTDNAETTKLLAELNTHVLGLRFTHQRQSGNAQVTGTAGEVEKHLTSSLSFHMDNFSNVEWLINNFYADPNVINNFNTIGRSNLNKIDILKLKRSQSQINLLRNLPNFLHIENIGEILQTVKANYAKEFLDKKATWTIELGLWNKMNLE